MKYPIIIKTAINPNLLLLSENVSHKAKSGDLDYPFYEFLRNEKRLPVLFNYNFNIFPPDVLYIDRQKNILIDIEIDEPYAHSGELTHYLNNTNDSFRNNYFSNNGVHVIRFSERQIANKMNICFLIIDYFIKSLSDIKYEATLNHWLGKIEEPIWTEEEAFKMKANDSRMCYPYDVIFPVNSTQIFNRNFELEDIVNIKLQNLADDTTIVIPTKLIQLINPHNKQKAFYYYGPHFSNSEYIGFSKKLVQGRIIDQNSFVYKYFEDVFSERIIFKNESTEFVPLMLIFESTDNEPIKIEKI